MFGVKAEDVPGSIVWRRTHDLDKGSLENAIDLALSFYGAKSSTDALARQLEAIAADVRRGHFTK